MLPLLLALLAHAAPPKEAPAAYHPSVEAITDETLKPAKGAEHVGMVWWLPTEWWEAALTGNPAVSPDQLTAFLDVLRPYVLVVVVDGKMGPMGGTTFRPEAEVRGLLRLRGADGALRSPIETSTVSPDAQMLVKMMQPMLAGMLGPMGGNMGFYFFDHGPGGKPLDPRGAKGFSILLGEDAYDFPLPLESLFAPVHCGVCARELKGTWKFCPYDGTKL